MRPRASCASPVLLPAPMTSIRRCAPDGPFRSSIRRTTVPPGRYRRQAAPMRSARPTTATRFAARSTRAVLIAWFSNGRSARSRSTRSSWSRRRASPGTTAAGGGSSSFSASSRRRRQPAASPGSSPRMRPRRRLRKSSPTALRWAAPSAARTTPSIRSMWRWPACFRRTVRCASPTTGTTNSSSASSAMR